MFNWTLGQKFSAFLALLALLGCCLTTYTLSCHFNQQAEQTVRERTEILLCTIQAARNYTRDRIQPLLERSADSPDSFVRESIPNFAARSVFNDFRNSHSSEFQDFLYKEAALNPTNPADQTDPFEAQLLIQMQAEYQQMTEQVEASPCQKDSAEPCQASPVTLRPSQEPSDAQTHSGSRTLNGEKLFYLAKPLVMDSVQCLTCHGRPSDAPAKLLEMYGSEGGFNWELNSVVAAQMMYVPANRVFERGQGNLLTVMKILLSIFGAMFIIINLLLWRAVSRPLSILTQTAKQISRCSSNSDILAYANQPIAAQNLSQLSQRQDEPGQLARAFEYMLHILRLREQDLQRAVEVRTQSLEQEMHDRQTAQESLQTYARAINHDLRNMVMGISNLLQVIALRWQRQSETAATSTITMDPQALDMMQKSCDRQLHLMNSLMEVQSADVWRSSLQRQAVDLKSLCQEIKQICQPKLKLASASLRLDLPEDLAPAIGDPHQIQRVFENLIGNALKYNPVGVSIVLSIRLNNIDPNSTWLRCTVSDDGIGTTAGNELFRPYRRGTANNQTSGQGLGLYICRQIVEAHGGEIGIRSSRSGGAAFWFTLPAQGVDRYNASMT